METVINKAQKYFWPWFAFYLVLPFYYQPNNGGTGFDLPFNITVWLMPCYFMALGLFIISASEKMIYPRFWWLFVIFPLVILLVSLFAPNMEPITWLFRQLYILGGALFLFVLFQFRYTNGFIDKILLLIALSGGLHSLIALLQIFSPELIGGFLPTTQDHVPRSIFQQTNVLASYLSTCIVLSLYIMTRPIYNRLPLGLKVLQILAFGLSVYIVVATGSRVGLLSLLLALPLLFIARYRWLLKRRSNLFFLLLVTVISVYFGQAGLEMTVDKASKISEGQYSDARLGMYKVGVELALERPLTGHGIGSFLRVWNIQSTTFLQQNPDAAFPPAVTHPHNELIFWTIESGLAALIGILAVVVGISIALYRCGFQRGMAYAALLLPISLHMQVELPFYLSSLHWFVWLFIIFIVLRHQKQDKALILSVAARKALKVAAVILPIVSTFFLVNMVRAQADLYNFNNDAELQPPYLKVAFDNLYFRPKAEKAIMRTLLYQSIKSGDAGKVKQAETWLNETIISEPLLSLYIDKIAAAQFLRPDENGCLEVEEALTMYSKFERFLSLKEDCDNLR
jgi:O-antigen polymerase